MTLRDYVKEHFPDNVGENFTAGVKSCPKDYAGLERYDCCENGEEGDCEKCWSQEYREPQKPKPKKLNASAVFIVLAVIEAAASAVAVVLGDSDTVRFCCVMGLLYITSSPPEFGGRIHDLYLLLPRTPRPPEGPAGEDVVCEDSQGA